MRKTLTTAVLLLSLSCPALAGEMQTPGAPTPPPASPVQVPTNDATLNGEIATPGVMPTPGLSDILTETALDLLAVLPALL
ncbi:MAG TPA: hypothetical protein VFZ44_05005 [Pyrinomonadaceae bacterium]